jgi:hypothetical protein
MPMSHSAPVLQLWVQQLRLQRIERDLADHLFTVESELLT